MVEVILKDGKVLEVAEGITLAELAKKISSSLKAAIAARVDGKLVDLSYVVNERVNVEFVVDGDPDYFHILNHSCAHLMAAAIQRLYPKALFAIGPAIKEGFYYDIDLDESITEEDLKKIEKEMGKIVAGNPKYERKDISKEDALVMFKDDPYKLEIVENLDGNISAYKTGDYLDLCLGPHVDAAAKLKNFKLLSVAGAYWRGDSNNKQLQRIYGVCFATKEQLDAHLHMLEEAKKRDHRKLGKELDLFFVPEEGRGFPLFQPNGMIIRTELINYWRKLHRREGYVEIETPLILDKKLWQTSGHWDHYRENMYTVMIDENENAIKPMNCPGGLIYYRNALHSYKEFPLRVGELGKVHRHEASGALTGLFRVRSFTQDDAHIFMLPSQVKNEILNVLKLIDEVYSTFGFKYHAELSTMPEDHIGTIEEWAVAEQWLKEALDEANMDYIINPGDGAFYGPKIDIHLEDCLGRTWQCGTIQLDSQLPQRFDITYIDENGEKKRPIMIHRVVYGSLERMMGILIEHFAGAFPAWLAPVQINVLPVSPEVHGEYCEKLNKIFFEEDFRTKVDAREEKLSYRLRESQIKKIPYTLVIGDKEVENNSVTYRKHGSREEINVSLNDFINLVKEDIKSKGKK